MPGLKTSKSEIESSLHKMHDISFYFPEKKEKLLEFIVDVLKLSNPLFCGFLSFKESKQNYVVYYHHHHY